MVKKGLLVRVVAKKGKEEQVQQFLTDAVIMAQKENKTITWYALKLDESTFGIFDSFESEDGREDHLNGEIAKALMKNAPDLLAKDPVIEKVDILAVK